MKRLVSMILILMLCLSAVSVLAEGEANAQIAAALAEIDYSDADTREMSNHRNMNRYITVNGVVYGRGWGEKIIRFEPQTGKKGKLTLSDSRVLMKNVVATWFCEADGAVFCYLNSFGENGERIIRIDETTNEITVIRKGIADYLMVSGGKLWFTNEEDQLCSMLPDGSEETVVLDRAVFYPYFIAEGLLYYQDDADGERGHVMEIASGEDMILTEDRTYQTIICGDTMYYLFCNAGEMTYHLARVNLKTLACEKTSFNASQMFIENGEIWFADDTHATLEEAWTRTKDVKGYTDTRLSYLYSNGEQYVRYGWKSGTASISNMKMLTVGTTKNPVELKVK